MEHDSFFLFNLQCSKLTLHRQSQEKIHMKHFNLQPSVVTLRVAWKAEQFSTSRNVARQVAQRARLAILSFVVVALQAARKITSCNMAFISAFMNLPSLIHTCLEPFMSWILQTLPWLLQVLWIFFFVLQIYQVYNSFFVCISGRQINVGLQPITHESWSCSCKPLKNYKLCFWKEKDNIVQSTNMSNEWHLYKAGFHMIRYDRCNLSAIVAIRLMRQRSLR